MMAIFLFYNLKLKKKLAVEKLKNL